MEHATTTTKSFLIALALVKGHLTVEEAARSAQVEVSSQIERWGEVEDSEILFSHFKPLESECSPTAHDIDFHDIRRKLGSASCLLSNI